MPIKTANTNFVSLVSFHQIQDTNNPSMLIKTFHIWQAYSIWLAYGNPVPSFN